MHVIMVGQNKGGDGKSTLTRLLAEYFARSGRSVLLIDVDPQCNLSQRFLQMDHDPTDPDGVLPPVHPEFDEASPITDYGSWNGRSSIADIFHGRPIFTYSTPTENLDILPGHGSNLREVEMVRREEVKERVHNRIHEFLDAPEVQDLYDLILIDTPPSKGPLTRSALRASSHMIIPCQMEPQSIEGLQGMLQLVRQENRMRPVDRMLKLIGIVANKMRKGVTLHEGLYQGLQDDPGIQPYLVPAILHQRTAFAESDHPSAVPKSVFELNPNIPARQEAEAVCLFVEESIYG